MNEIKSLLMQIVETDEFKKTELVDCVVLSYNDSNKSVNLSPLSDSSTDFDVFLCTDVESVSDLIIVPKIDSIVTVVKQNNIPTKLLAFSQIEKIVFKNGTEGIVNVVPLVKEINDLKKLVNDLLNTLKNTTIPLAPAGSYPFAPLYAQFQNIPDTEKKDLENINFLH